MRKLEDELGVELVERGTRPLLLTEVGHRIVDRARKIQREVADITEIARSGADQRAGRIRLGIFPTLGPYLIPHVMPVLRDNYPQLEIQLVEAKTAQILADLATAELDVGILALPVESTGLRLESLFMEDFVLALPASHKGITAPVPVSVLAEENIMLLEEGHCLRDQALAVCQAAGVSESEFRATSLEMLRQMVAAGSGATLLPKLAVAPPVPTNPDLRTYEFTGPAPQREIGMVWRQSSAHRQFFPELAKTFRTVAQSVLEPAN
jgi:LysR family hydrogen peroxide-inducible transcriptional activator